jgi:DNA-directed RNA polymerase subunit RPC12/RpoP
MEAVPAPVQILCRQCSAPLPVEQGTQYFDCEYCGTTNVVEKGQTVFHYAVRTTIRENEALAALRRWMAGNKTIKGLDRLAKIDTPKYEHLPFWFVRADRNGQEKIYLEPAAAISISELKHLTIPAADLEPYDLTMDDSAVEATVPYKAMLKWLGDEQQIKESDITEVSLVHLPLYVFKYAYKDRRYTAVVDAATAQVFANIYPSKWETPYLAIGAAAFVAYFCAALIPLGGFIAGDAGGLGLGLLIYAGVAVVLAVLFFSAAATVSAKV